MSETIKIETMDTFLKEARHVETLQVWSARRYT